MKRKLIKQGKGALTVSLPKKWISFNELKAGDEINLNEEENLIIISNEFNKNSKSISISLKLDSYESCRNIIASLYRGCYDEVHLNFKEKKAISYLQKVVDSLHGFEIFDIENNSCILKSIYREESQSIDSYIRRIIYGIQAMQEILINDIKEKNFNSKGEIYQLRNNVLKQRDLIMRTIKKNKLIDNKHFPYYSLAINLWKIVRNYYHLYINLDEKMEFDERDLNLFKEIENYFRFSFDRLNSMDLSRLSEKNKMYQKIRNKAISIIKKKPSFVNSFALNIIFAIQFSDSFIYLLNQD